MFGDNPCVHYSLTLSKIQEIFIEISNFRQRWFQMLFEIFHCHCGQVKQFLDYDVWTPQFRCGTDIIQNIVDFIQDLKPNAHTQNLRKTPPDNRHIIRNAISLTLPGKKQMWFRSICFPKVICSNDNRMWHVSTISHSPADGWDRLADSLELKFISLTLSYSCWNRH